MASSKDLESGYNGEPAITAAEERPATLPNSSQSNESSGKRPYNMKSELEIFQTLVGIRFLAPGGGPSPEADKMIRPASPLMDIFRPSKTSDNRFRNRGLYDRSLSQDLKYRLLYSISYYIIFSLYIWQVLLAATITALSAYHAEDAIAITVLGALNTVVAGLLAWVNGQGMPVRFRRARDLFREVVKQIEVSERMFAEIEYVSWPAGLRPDPVAERDRLEKLFEEARIDQEANYPDVHYDPATGMMQQRNQELQEEVQKWRAAGQTDVDQIRTLRAELEKLKETAPAPANPLQKNE